MSLLSASLAHLERMLSVTDEMKALLLDKDTSLLLGLVSSLSHLLSRHIFLTERIDLDSAPHNSAAARLASSAGLSGSVSSVSESESFLFDRSLHHLRAIVFIRPSASSLSALRRLLWSRRFRSLHLHFTSALSNEALRALAEADVLHSVVTVHEVFLDYFTLHAHLFHFDLPSVRALQKERSLWSKGDHALYLRHIDGLASVMLSLKKQCEIRFEARSPLCRFIASELQRRIQDDRELFDFGQPTKPPPLLLLLNRYSDPVTPLLMQWTYTAMCHELLTINYNCINLAAARALSASSGSTNKVKPTPHSAGHEQVDEVVMSMDSDHFYKGSAWLNFGDLGASIQDLVKDFQRKTSSHAKLDTIVAMQQFVDNYPEFRALSGTVSKHVAVMSELSRLVDARKLLIVSECEQELVCTDDVVAANERVEKLLKDKHIAFSDALRIVMLYHLRYEDAYNTNIQISRWRALLREKAGNDVEMRRRVSLVDDVIKIAGAKQRSGELFEPPKSIFARASRLLSSGIRGVENIYTQHKPLLGDIVAAFMNGDASEEQFPATTQTPLSPQYRFIIVFIVGGVTYEESLVAEMINKGSSGVKIILGGSFVHNSTSFMNDLLPQPTDPLRSASDESISSVSERE